jgi:hypothetical protein
VAGDCQTSQYVKCFTHVTSPPSVLASFICQMYLPPPPPLMPNPLIINLFPFLALCAPPPCVPTRHAVVPGAAVPRAEHRDDQVRTRVGEIHSHEVEYFA